VKYSGLLAGENKNQAKTLHNLWKKIFALGLLKYVPLRIAKKKIVKK